jgi:hypothetical protein
VAGAGVGVGGGPWVVLPVGPGVHQNQPTAVPLPPTSIATGSLPVCVAISSRIAGSTGRNARNCHGM